MMEQLEPALVKLFVLVISTFGTLAVHFLAQYLRRKSKAEHLLAIEIGENLLNRYLQDAVNAAEEYHHALESEGASKTPGKTKLAFAVDSAVDAISKSPLPNIARFEVEKLIVKELGKMRANGQKG